MIILIISVLSSTTLIISSPNSYSDLDSNSNFLNLSKQNKKDKYYNSNELITVTSISDQVRDSCCNPIKYFGFFIVVD